MHKVIFVDDEPWVIVDIIDSIPWKQLGFEVIGYYESPLEALGAIRTQEPDLVFVDINMPEINGFELIHRCRENDSDALFVILSAYSDFEYAKRAIRSAVLDYWLKPINPPIIIKSLEEMKTRLDERASIKQAEKEAETAFSERPAGESEQEERFNKILDYVKSNFNKKLLLQELAELFNFNKNYICYLFKKYTGNTFSAYIIRQRAEHAKFLLETTAHPLRVIAEESGFIDCYYLSKIFKAAYGVPPNKYRRQLKKGGEN
jgi:two-component system response regulator YesN